MPQRKLFVICAAYLLLITCAELVTTPIIVILYDPKAGIASHALILFVLLLHSARESDKDKNLSSFLMALVLAPLIRILSLSLPFIHFTTIAGFLLISIPIFIAIFTCMRLQGLQAKDVGLSMPKLNLGHLSIEAGVILFAIPFGIVEYLILKPRPLAELEIANFITAALIFIVCTGLLEELVFRGLLQHNAIKLLNKWWGILLVSMIFGVLHVGNISPWHLDCVLAFSAGFVYSVVREKTGSIYGISLSHGITNIILFLVMPVYQIF